MGRTKKLSTEEKLKIINSNPALWLKNFVKIVNSEGELIPFELNDEQKYFVENMGKYNIILKSRQLGFSTLALGLMLYYAHTIPNSNYLLLSHDTESTYNLFTRLKQMYDSMPERYKCDQKRNNRMEIVLENGSRISIKVAGSVKELGRSFTLQMIHCSEFAFWPEEQQVDGLLALEQALAKNDKAMIVIESTANGVGNNFYNLFMNAYKNNSKYKAFFFNWYSNKKQFKYEYDLAEKWYKGHSGGKRLKEEDLTHYEKMLYQDGATLKQLMWRRWKLLDLTEKQFQQEYPATPNEAFITSNVSVFDVETIIDRMNYLPAPITADIELENLPLELKKYVGRGLYIYKIPKPKEWYFGGVDTSAGLKKDYSAVVILDSSGEQVCSFYRNDVPTYAFAKIVDILGRYYNYALLMVERNNYGLDVLQRLRKEMQYQNLAKTKKFDKVKGSFSWDFGFNTDSVSKTKLINDLREAFDLGLILVNDKETLEQMRIYQEFDNGKMGNFGRHGVQHDDLVIALALAVQSMKQNRYYVNV